MTGLLKSTSSTDKSSKDYDPIVANRSTSWASSISFKRTKSASSTVANSTDLSLVYSSDTEFREMLEEYSLQKEVRVAPSPVASMLSYPPSERNALPPRSRSTKSTASNQKPPLTVQITNEEKVPPIQSLVMKTACAMGDVEKRVEKSAREFETFVTSRVDMALSPVEDKIETFLYQAQSFAKGKDDSKPAVEADSPEVSKTPPSENKAPALTPSFLSGLLGSLFNDEPMPVLPAASSLSEDASSVATEHSSIDSQNTAVHKNDERPSYEKMMETLLGDESMPDPLGPGIPSSIEIRQVP